MSQISTTDFLCPASPLPLDTELREYSPNLPDKHRDWGAVPAEMYRAALDIFARGDSWPLVLAGPPGCGKTCLALLMLDGVRQPRVYHELPGLCARVSTAMRGELTSPEGYKVSANQIWKRWAGAPLAVLDEVGSRERVSDHHYEVAKKAIDSREERPLVVVTNNTLDEIAALYDKRISSRLSGGRVLAFPSADRRRDQ